MKTKITILIFSCLTGILSAQTPNSLGQVGTVLSELYLANGTPLTNGDTIAVSTIYNSDGVIEIEDTVRVVGLNPNYQLLYIGSFEDIINNGGAYGASDVGYFIDNAYSGDGIGYVSSNASAYMFKSTSPNYESISGYNKVSHAQIEEEIGVNNDSVSYKYMKSSVGSQIRIASKNIDSNVFNASVFHVGGKRGYVGLVKNKYGGSMPNRVNPGWNIVADNKFRWRATLNDFNNIDIMFDDSISNNITLYEKYQLPNAQPSTTNGTKSIMTWTGNGTNATPSFEAYEVANTIYNSDGVIEIEDTVRVVRLDSDYQRLYIGDWNDPKNNGPFEAGSSGYYDDYWDDGGLGIINSKNNVSKAFQIYDFGTFSSTYNYGGVSNSTTGYSPIFKDLASGIFAGKGFVSTNIYCGLDSAQTQYVSGTFSTKPGSSFSFVGTTWNNSGTSMHPYLSQNKVVGTPIPRFKVTTRYFENLAIDVNDSTSHNIMLYQKYRLPNAQPSTTNGTKSIMTWAGNGTSATPSFEPYEVANTIYNASDSIQNNDQIVKIKKDSTFSVGYTDFNGFEDAWNNGGDFMGLYLSNNYWGGLGLQTRRKPTQNFSFIELDASGSGGIIIDNRNYSATRVNRITVDTSSVRISGSTASGNYVYNLQNTQPSVTLNAKSEPTQTGSGSVTVPRFTRKDWGNTSATTDASGDITVTCVMPDTGYSATVTTTGTTFAHPQVHTKTATSFKVRFFDAAGNVIATTAVAADWQLIDN